MSMTEMAKNMPKAAPMSIIYELIRNVIKY